MISFPINASFCQHHFLSLFIQIFQEHFYLFLFHHLYLIDQCPTRHFYHSFSTIFALHSSSPSSFAIYSLNGLEPQMRQIMEGPKCLRIYIATQSSISSVRSSISHFFITIECQNSVTSITCLDGKFNIIREVFKLKFGYFGVLSLNDFGKITKIIDIFPD